MAAAMMRSASRTLNSPLKMAPMMKLKMDAASATTMACTCTSMRLATTMDQRPALSSSWPLCAAVDSREASTISKLPLRPSSAGAKMNSSEMSTKSGQCCEGIGKAVEVGDNAREEKNEDENTRS